MESWENIILQWINCLCSSNNSIKSIEDLQDGKIYYNLINRVIPWSSKDTNDNERDMVMQFLGEEYPNYAFRNRNSTISNLCTASLILSRLSLEPVFHKSLCKNLDGDAQVTIKSILESVYSLGKSITAEDLCEIFSLSSKADFKSLAIKPKFILEEFLKSPAARTIQNDKKQFEQAKQIRQLKAEIETMKYEKSELVEDMKIQDRQIKDLQNKLQEALMELKSIKVDSSKRNSCNFSEGKDKNGLEAAYLKELESLEKYVSELQTENYQLQDDKKALSNDARLYKEKYQLIKEKNESNEQAIETMLLEIEKKEDELMEMKMKYDELLNHVKERTKTLFNNQNLCNASFEVDDSRIIAELSINRSEALSSVIEIQLEEVRKDYNMLQKEYKDTNILLSVFVEEYEKLKQRNESLIISHREAKAKLRMEYMMDTIAKIQNNLIKNDSIIKEKIRKDIGSSIECDIKLPLTNTLEEDSQNTLSLQLLNKDDAGNDGKAISLEFNNKSNSFINTKNIIEKYDRMVKIRRYSEKPPLIKVNVTMPHQNESKKPTFVFKVLLQEIVTGLVGVTGENDILKNLLFKIAKNDSLTNNTDDYFNLINFVKHNFEAKSKCLNEIEGNNNVSNEIAIDTLDWNIVNSTWTSLSESLENDVKIHKILLLLEQSWLFVSALLKDVVKCNSLIQPGFEELLRKKDKIENELKKIRFENSQMLSFNLIAAVQFINTLTKNISSYDLKNLNILTENDTQIDLSDISQLNVQQRKDLATKIINVKRRIDNFNYCLNSYKEEMTNAALNNIVEDDIIENLTNDNNKTNNDQTDNNNIERVCVPTVKQEIEEEDICNDSLEPVNSEIKVEENVSTEIITKEITEEEIVSTIKMKEENVSTETIKKEVKDENDTTEIIKTEIIEEPEVIVDKNKEDNKSANQAISEEKSKPVLSQNEVFIELVKKEIPKEKVESINENVKANTIIESDIKVLEEKKVVKPSTIETGKIAKPPEKEVEHVNNENEVQSKSATKKEETLDEAGSSKSDTMTTQQVERYVREIHEKYELKLERMKEKMKSAFNSQVSSLRREQEQSFKSRMDALQAKLEQQCYSHSEELRKYKKHISELTTQLWDVGEKLIIEKQKKEEFVHKVKELKTRHESSLSQHPQQQSATLPRPSSHRDKENRASAAQLPAEPLSKMQSVRGFQIMGNAFRSEDEEGELFDTTYLTDVQRQRANPEVDRLSILQLRNAKCKPHLKSSYPAEMQFYPASLTEDEIKSGSAQDETFNDSLSQSLLTGKKVKRKDRTRTAAETPRSRRRFSNIFRKPRLSLDHK